MIFALVAAAIILMVAAALLYRGFRRRPARAPAAGARPTRSYDALGCASHSAVGDGQLHAVFSGAIELPSGAAFLGVVADGMGGAADAERARTVALREFLSALRAEADESGQGIPLPTRLKTALEAAHGAVREVAGEVAGEGAELGASVAAVVIRRDGLHWVSIGNSRVCLYRDDALHQVTVDHTFGARLANGVMRGQLSPAEAAGKQERDALTRYVGGSDPLEPDASRRPFPLRDGDRVILCTRGVHGLLTAEEMAATIRSAGDGASEALVQRALSAASAPTPTIAAVDFLFSPAAGAARPTTRPLHRSNAARTTVRVAQPDAESEGVRAL